MKRINKNKLQKSNKRRAIFLDRDGTINYDYGYTHKFSDFKFRPYVIKGLSYLTKKDYLIFIVTNQAGIAKGIFKMADLTKLHKKLLYFLKNKKITINEIQFCPYHPEGIIKKFKKKTNYRKPGNLMIKKIINNWNIDLDKSFMLGDKKTDKLAANKSNLYFEYVEKNFFKQVVKIVKKHQ